MFCICIYRRSRPVYEFLSNYLPLPSITTLNTTLRDIIVTPGCNETTIKYLKSVAQEIAEEDLYCVIIWDEMSVQPAVQYDSTIDKFAGFEDWGMKRSRQFVNHALIFYMKCLFSGKHMPLGYGFCHNSTNTMQLVRCIKQWLRTLLTCGFKPLATICDQESTNITAINYLVNERNKGNVMLTNHSK